MTKQRLRKYAGRGLTGLGGAGAVVGLLLMVWSPVYAGDVMTWVNVGFATAITGLVVALAGMVVRGLDEPW